MRSIKTKHVLRVLWVSFLTLIVFSCSTDELQESNEYQKKVETINKIAQELDANIKIDSSVTKSNAIVINSEQEYRDFIKKIKNETAKNNSASTKLEGMSSKSAIYYGPGADVVNFNCFENSKRVYNSGFTTLWAYIVVVNNKLRSAYMYLSGFVLGLRYTELSSITAGNIAYLHGLLSVDIFYEGIGTVYSEDVRVEVHYNCLSSNY